MTSHLPVVRLDDYCEVDSGFAFKSERFSQNPEDINLVKGSNLGHRIIDWVEGPKWSKDEYEKLKFYELKTDDVVLAMDRPIVGGNLKFAWMSKSDPLALLVQRVARLRAKEGLDQIYLRYVIADTSFKLYIDTITTGANIPHISGPDIRSYKFPLPSIATQNKTAAILSAYDDLIENNLKRIKLLEEMAQITYEEWFVRLKFPGHETTPLDSTTGLPVGWEIANIGSLIGHEIGGGWGEEEKDNEFSEPAFVIRGTDFDNLPTGNIENVPFRFHKKSNLASRKLQDGDIIFEVSGGSHNEGVAKSIIITNELLAKFNADVMCASFCKLARPTRKENSYLLFHFLRFLRATKGTEVFEIRSASNIVNYNWTAFLKFQLIKLPSQEILIKFNYFAEAIHKQIYKLGKQNQLLKEARDILLPRLMTGMIDVEQLPVAQLDIQ